MVLQVIVDAYTCATHVVEYANQSGASNLRKAVLDILAHNLNISYAQALRIL